MEPWAKPVEEKPKRSKWTGCLVGCLAVFGAVILFILILAYILFRVHPSLKEETFFTPEVTGFARVQMEALRNPQMRELFQNVLKETQPPSERGKTAQGNLDSFFSGLNMFLHERHFVYLYQGEGETPDYLAVINIKRCSWIITSMLSGEGNKAIEKIPPPRGVRAHCFLLKQPKEGGKELQKLAYIATTPQGLFISNTESRLISGLSCLGSNKPAGGLSPLAQSLLPPDNSSDMINGFCFWQDNWNTQITENLQKEYPQSKEMIQSLDALLAQTRLEGVKFEVQMASSDVLRIVWEVLCADEKEASLIEEALQKQIKPQIETADRGVNFSVNGKIIKVDVQISGVQKWLLQKMGPPPIPPTATPQKPGTTAIGEPTVPAEKVR